MKVLITYNNYALYKLMTPYTIVLGELSPKIPKRAIDQPDRLTTPVLTTPMRLSCCSCHQIQYHRTHSEDDGALNY